jgi:hypothetical protein
MTDMKPSRPSEGLIVSRGPRRHSPFDSDQHQLDEEWFEQNAGRRLRARWATNGEFVESQLPRVKGRGWRDLAVVARGWDGSHYVRTLWAQAENVGQWLAMNDGEMLARLDDETQRFFQSITTPYPDLSERQREFFFSAPARSPPSSTKRN